jgi:hypothetical protein
VTITDIGILLIILCVLLWAIMAALHRHTVQLDALRKQIEALQQNPPRATDSGGGAPAAKPRDDHKELSVAARREW